MSDKLSQALHDWQTWPCANWPLEQAKITPLHGGLSNECYRIQIANYDLVLRLIGEQQDIDRRSELAIYQLLEKQNSLPKLRFRSATHHYWLRDFVVGEALKKQDLNYPILQQMVLHLKKIHQLPVPEQTACIDLLAKADFYWQRILSSASDQALPALKIHLQKTITQSAHSTLHLCHMDPTPANWVLKPDKGLVLLDWEYAGLGNPLWDLAALLNEATLNAAEESTLLSYYGVESEQQWQLAKIQMHYLSALWYAANRYWHHDKLTNKLNAIRTALDQFI